MCTAAVRARASVESRKNGGNRVEPRALLLISLHKTVEYWHEQNVEDYTWSPINGESRRHEFRELLRTRVYI